MGKHVLTDSKNRSKCLAYRAGKRCGRLARFLVSWKDFQGHYDSPVCQECKDRIVQEHGGQVKEENRKGFTVHIVGIGYGRSREYRKVD